jgi:hypothetical protein
MNGETRPPCAPPATADTATAQADDMGAFARELATANGDPNCNNVLAIIAHAIAVIGHDMTTATAAYSEGQLQARAAARHAVALAMQRRRWRVGHDSGDVFDDGDFNGTTLVIELTSAQEARAVSALMLEVVGADG